MTSSCHRTNLASYGSFKVERCSCGSIHLHIGAMTLRLEPTAMEQLAATLSEATANNRKMERQIEVLGLRLSPQMGENTDLNEVALRMSMHCDSDKDFH